MHDPVDTLPPMRDPAPEAEITEPHTDIPSMTEEPVEIEESFTASPFQPEVPPMVSEAPLESLSGPDQELSVDLGKSPEVETDLMLCPTDVSNRPQSTPAGSDGPDAEPEVEPTDERIDSYPELPEIPVGSRSLVPLPHASSQNDTPRSEDYKYCQSLRYRMDHLSGCSRL